MSKKKKFAFLTGITIASTAVVARSMKNKAKNNTYIVLLKNNKFFKRKMCLIFPLKPYIIGISR